MLRLIRVCIAISLKQVEDVYLLEADPFARDHALDTFELVGLLVEVGGEFDVEDLFNYMFGYLVEGAALLRDVEDEHLLFAHCNQVPLVIIKFEILRERQVVLDPSVEERHVDLVIQDVLDQRIGIRGAVLLRGEVDNRDFVDGPLLLWIQRLRYPPLGRNEQRKQLVIIREHFLGPLSIRNDELLLDLWVRIASVKEIKAKIANLVFEHVAVSTFLISTIHIVRINIEILTRWHNVPRYPEDVIHIALERLCFQYIECRNLKLEAVVSQEALLASVACNFAILHGTVIFADPAHGLEVCAICDLVASRVDLPYLLLVQFHFSQRESHPLFVFLVVLQQVHVLVGGEGARGENELTIGLLLKVYPIEWLRRSPVAAGIVFGDEGVESRVVYFVLRHVGLDIYHQRLRHCRPLLIIALESRRVNLPARMNSLLPIVVHES